MQTALTNKWINAQLEMQIIWFTPMFVWKGYKNAAHKMIGNVVIEPLAKRNSKTMPVSERLVD